MKRNKSCFTWILIVLFLGLTLPPSSAWSQTDTPKKKKDKKPAATAKDKKAKRQKAKKNRAAEEKSASADSSETTADKKSDANKTTDAKSDDSAKDSSTAASAATGTSAPVTPTTPAPSTATVTKGPIKVEVVLQGNLEATSTTEVSIVPKQWAQLTVVEAVPAGTRVNKGDTLLKLDTTKIDDAIRDIESAQALADLSLKQAKENYQILEKSIPLEMELADRAKSHAEQDYELYVKVDAPQAKKSADFQLRFSEQNLEYTTEELKQLEKMYKADDLTEETEEIILKRARNDVERAQHSTEQARIRHERTTSVELPRTADQQEHSLKQALLTWEKAKLTIPAQKEKQRLDLEKMELEYKKSQEKLAELKGDRELLTIKAPAAGIVHYGRSQNGKWITATTTAQKFRPGGSISPYEVLFTIVSDGSWAVRGSLAEKDLASVKPGLTGRFKLTAYPDSPLQVKVREVGAVPNTEGTFDIAFDVISTPAQPLVAGMTGEVRMVVYFSAEAILVPTKAVFSEDADDQKKYVYLAGKDSKPEKRTIQTGHVQGEMTEVISGLSGGESILLQKPAS